MGFRKSQLLPAPALDSSFVSAGQEVMQVSQKTYDSIYAAWPNEVVVALAKVRDEAVEFWSGHRRCLGAHHAGERGSVSLICWPWRRQLQPRSVLCVHLHLGRPMPYSSLQMRILLPHLLFANVEYSCARGLCSLVLDTVRTLLHQPDLCFYLS